MKALLLKDFYLLKSYCKTYVLICALFLAISLGGAGNLFFVAYPAMLCSLIPVTLMTYDERSRWTEYCACLPFTRAQMVGGKYLIGLLCSSAVLVLSAAAILSCPGVSGNDKLLLLLLTLCLSLVSPAICLPMVFRFGAEKGRLVYYFAVGIFFALSYFLAAGFGTQGSRSLSGSFLPAAVAATLVCVGLYAASWLVSVRIFEKKEL